MPADARITARPSAGVDDLVRIDQRTVDSMPDALHLIDLPWRLTSPSAQVPERTRLWEDGDGTLVAWAILQFQWHCLDYAILPTARTSELESAILAWGTEQLKAEAAARDGSLPFTVGARQDDAARIAAIERADFSPGGWSYIHLVRDLELPIPASEPPAGFAIRPLAGEQEVAAYVATHRAAFGSTNMTEDWRSATLRHHRYTPGLDLVATAPGGDVVGFCVAWITPPLDALAGRRIAQVEPLGVLPDYQRMGLGRALLLESLRRAKELGAQRIEVNAESDNDASGPAYETVGFRPMYETPFFIRHFG